MDDNTVSLLLLDILYQRFVACPVSNQYHLVDYVILCRVTLCPVACGKCDILACHINAVEVPCPLSA